MAAKIRTFRDLIAWQKGMDLAVMVYEVTNAMPGDERFGLTSQVRRAAASVPMNIAEGYGRQSRKDYIKFLKIARGSLMELMTGIELAHRLEMVEYHQGLDDLMAEEDRILQGLIRSLQK